MATVYLALGANTGDPAGQIRQAITLLTQTLNGLRQAPVYKSKAVGYTDQPDFLNTAVSGQTDLKPADLLATVKDIEQQVGRTPTFHHGPREIDIDLILYNSRVIKTDRLTLPHPRFRERDFVLQPLKDLAPDLKDPVTGKSVSQLLSAITASDRSITSRA